MEQIKGETAFRQQTAQENSEIAATKVTRGKADIFNGKISVGQLEQLPAPEITETLLSVGVFDTHATNVTSNYHKIELQKELIQDILPLHVSDIATGEKLRMFKFLDTSIFYNEEDGERIFDPANLTGSGYSIEKSNRNISKYEIVIKLFVAWSNMDFNAKSPFTSESDSVLSIPPFTHYLNKIVEKVIPLSDILEKGNVSQQFFFSYKNNATGVISLVTQKGIEQLSNFITIKESYLNSTYSEATTQNPNENARFESLPDEITFIISSTNLPNNTSTVGGWDGMNYSLYLRKKG